MDTKEINKKKHFDIHIKRWRRRLICHFLLDSLSIYIRYALMPHPLINTFGEANENAINENRDRDCTGVCASFLFFVCALFQ